MNHPAPKSDMKTLQQLNQDIRTRREEHAKRRAAHEAAKAADRAKQAELLRCSAATLTSYEQHVANGGD